MLDQATVALEVFDHDKDDALNKDTEVTEVSENVKMCMSVSSSDSKEPSTQTEETKWAKESVSLSFKMFWRCVRRKMVEPRE